MADNPRIEELRRRVQADPASIAFAALAEEYRRSGQYAEAIETCRTGLQRHPSYISARVTLGRALIETGEYEAARTELESVLKVAPENLAAIRAMAEIHERLDHLAEAAAPAPAASGSDPSVASRPAAIPVAQAAPAPAVPVEAPQPAQATVLDWQPRSVAAPRGSSGGAEAQSAAIERLEAFLASIVAARASLS